MSRRFDFNPRVREWLPTIQKCREDLGLSAARYSDATILALIHVESSGNECARRKGSRYYGLLQMANAYVQDACEYWGVPVVPASELQCDGEAQILMALQYFERYRKYHDYQPSKVAILHKGGPGTAKRVDKRHAQTGDLVEAAEHVERTFVDKNGDPYAPNLTEYLHEFRKAHQLWTGVLEAEKASAQCLTRGKPRTR